MAKIVIFYWEPGSSGDFVVSSLLSNSEEYQGITEKFSLTTTGRILPTASTFLTENFACDEGMWYQKTWTVDDCQMISTYANNLDCNFFVIPTHRFEQVDVLKSIFANSITLGITYSNNMFPLVLKNWCKKVAPTDSIISEIYNKPLHQYLKNKGGFGEFVMSEQLKYKTNTRAHVSDQFDLSISLEDLYKGDLFSVTMLLHNSNHVSQLYQRWIEKQSIIHRFQYNIPLVLKEALGYNSKAPYSADLNIPLDMFDNILIKHHCTIQNIPYFGTLQQAADFFNNFNKST